MQLDPTNRFSRRAEYYDAYRPKYPRALVNYLESQLTFSKQAMVADVGSGTGILTELLLQNGNTVFGVEPNEDMRKMAEANLSKYRGFKSINASAEATTLVSRSVDFITAAQSFHWIWESCTKKHYPKAKYSQKLQKRQQTKGNIRSVRDRYDWAAAPGLLEARAVQPGWYPRRVRLA